MRDSITDREWETFCAEGYLRLGRTVEERELARLLERIDAIMLGRAPLDYSRMMMQLDTETGVFTDMGPQTKGHKGATLGYRKITELEFDPLHLRYMQKPLFRHLCARAYGPDTSITCFRAMFINKPASRGTHLPWHQDVFRQLDRQPRITAWLALDDATIDKGCLRIIPRSHGQLAHANAESAFPDDATVHRLLDEGEPVHLEVEAGEAFSCTTGWSTPPASTRRGNPGAPSVFVIWTRPPGPPATRYFP